jgi:GntR family transcriptional regulator / MocR family aminotransferase
MILLAYDQLLAEGFVEGRHGSGTFVSKALGRTPQKASERLAKPRLSRFGTSVEAVVSKLNLSAHRPTSARYNFALGRAAVQEFPFEAWRRILLRRARKAPLAELEYGPSAGSLALREAIADHLRRSRAVVCDASQVIVVAGSQQALDLASRVLLERGDRVAIEEPHYIGGRDVFRACGARLHPVPVDREGLRVDQLPERAKLAFVTPSHQFPTGAILPLARRLKLLEWAKRADATVIEDDYDGEFHYEGQPVESLQGLDTEGRVLYIGTFSRTIFPALRIGYLIAPKSLVPALTAAKWLCDRHTPTLEQETLAEFLNSGAYERHLRRMRKRNVVRRKALLEAVEIYLGKSVGMTGDGAGAHVILWPKRQDTEENLIARAAALGVAVYGTSQYFLKAIPPIGLLLGYSRLTEDEIREGIKRLGKIIVN